MTLECMPQKCQLLCGCINRLKNDQPRWNRHDLQMCNQGIKPANVSNQHYSYLTDKEGISDMIKNDPIHLKIAGLESPGKQSIKHGRYCRQTPTMLRGILSYMAPECSIKLRLVIRIEIYQLNLQ